MPHPDYQPENYPDTLTDKEARIIAAWWQDGRFPGLAALASTGAILDDAPREINENIRGTTDPEARALWALHGYVHANHPRSSVPGWNRRNGWTSADERTLEWRFGLPSD